MTKYTRKDFTVGQKLYVVFSQKYHDKSRYFTVDKIGRSYLTLQGEHGAHDVWKADIEDLTLKGSFFDGRAYLTKKNYEEKLLVDKMWRRLADFFRSYRMPDDITKEKLTKLLDTLNLTIYDEKEGV